MCVYYLTFILVWCWCDLILDRILERIGALTGLLNWEVQRERVAYLFRCYSCSNTTSEVSAYAASSTHDGLRDDDHVAFVVRSHRPIHLSPLPGWTACTQKSGNLKFKFSMLGKSQHQVYRVPASWKGLDFFS